jgi:hypothetical protein
MKKGLLITAFFLFSLGLLFPYFASSSFGKPFILLFLQKDLPGHLTVEKIDLSWLGPQRFEKAVLTLDSCTIRCDTISSQLPLWQIPNWERHVIMQNGSFGCSEYPGSEIINIQASIEQQNIEMTGTTPHKGSLSVRGTLPLHHNPFDLTVQLQNIPTIVLDNLLRCNLFLTKILGPLCNVDASYRFQEEEEALNLDLISTYAKSTLRAKIQDNVLTLTSPWICAVSVSDPLRKALLSRMQSQWISDIQMKNPITLQISPEGFSCPIFPFVLEKLQIQNGTLNLGKVLLQSDPSTRFLMKLLKGQGVTNPILCWFTKIPFGLQNNVLSLGRFDALLSQSIHLCAWGDVNVRNEQLQMFLGIPVATLQNSIDVSSFPSDYVFKVPITGTLSHPQFETGPAFGKIATVTIAKQIPSKPGKVIGGLINAAVTTQQQTDIPPPNRPFPWEK